jgi:hypothetical protein
MRHALARPVRLARLGARSVGRLRRSPGAVMSPGSSSGVRFSAGGIEVVAGLYHPEVCRREVGPDGRAAPCLQRGWSSPSLSSSPRARHRCAMSTTRPAGCPAAGGCGPESQQGRVLRARPVAEAFITGAAAASTCPRIESEECNPYPLFGVTTKVALVGARHWLEHHRRYL